MRPFQNDNDSQFLAASFQTAVSGVSCGYGDCSERCRPVFEIAVGTVNRGECLLLKLSSKSSSHNMEHNPRVPGGLSVIL
jgi:hypothetical protein